MTDALTLTRVPFDRRLVNAMIPRPVTANPAVESRKGAPRMAPIPISLAPSDPTNKIAMIERLNRKLAGWAAFYRFTDYTATAFQRIDHVVFWKMGHWLGRKHKTSIKSLMRLWYRRPAPGRAKTWFIFGRDSGSILRGVALRRLVGSHSSRFLWRNPPGNPYITGNLNDNAITSRYQDVAMAMGRV